MAHKRKPIKNVNTEPYRVTSRHNPDKTRFRPGDIVRLDERGRPRLVAKPKRGKK